MGACAQMQGVDGQQQQQPLNVQEQQAMQEAMRENARLRAQLQGNGSNA